MPIVLPLLGPTFRSACLSVGGKLKHFLDTFHLEKRSLKSGRLKAYNSNLASHHLVSGLDELRVNEGTTFGIKYIQLLIRGHHH